jgi:hypothetical protein
VREEADFYQVKSLLKLLTPPPQFNTEFYGTQVHFSNNNTVATLGDESDDEDRFSIVMSSTPFVISEHADFAEKIIKLVKSPGEFEIVFGLAPAKLLSDSFLGPDNCGYHCDTMLGLFGEGVENGVQFKDGNIEPNLVLQLRLHRDKSVSLVLEGEDLGVAFRDVNTEEPLYLVVTMYSEGDCVELLPDFV